MPTDTFALGLGFTKLCDPQLDSTYNLFMFWMLFAPILSWSSVPVYMAPTPSLPTGHYHLQELQSALRKTRLESWSLVKDETGLTAWVPADSLFSTIDFSQKAVHKGQTVKILERADQLARVQKQNRQLWVPVEELTPHDQDPGLFVTKTPTWLHSSPSHKSRTQQLSSRRWLRPLRFVQQGHWYQVELLEEKTKKPTGVMGFVKTQSLLSRLHIADHIYFNSKWHKQEMSQDIPFHQPVAAIQTGTQELINIKTEVTAVDQLDNILHRSPQAKMLSGHRLKVLRTKTLHWFQSQLPKIGPVWWATTQLPKPAIAKKAPQWQSIHWAKIMEDLKIREASHMKLLSVDKKNPLTGELLVSFSTGHSKPRKAYSRDGGKNWVAIQ